MDRYEQIEYLISYLLQEMPQYQVEASSFDKGEVSQRRLLRSLMNVRMPMPLNKEFLEVQDALLQQEAATKGIVEITALKPIQGEQLYVWQGDITRLKVDAIVNAANSQMLGCFVPCHGCIDNAIHSAAGLQLRDACSQIVKKQGREEPVGQAKITPAYNLPAKYVIHTVGPIIYDAVHDKEEKELYSCYHSCLLLAQQNHLKSIAFCCISTGEYHYPNEAAAVTAVKAVKDFLFETKSEMKVIFNVYKDIDADIYRTVLQSDQ
jgi:O-acetyl-ADP-ribose deacetylase (regulator of RNase III)